MDFVPIAADINARAEPRRTRATMSLIILYWICQFVFLTVQRRLMMMGEAEELSFLLPRGAVAIVGIVLSFGIDQLHRRCTRGPWLRRLAIAMAAAVGAALLHSIANFFAFQLAMPEENMRAFSVASYFSAVVQWFWGYAAISGLLLTGAYNDALRERERRLVELQALAHSAQLRSLRYQLNPHFMFNTLNSIAALIGSGDAQRAEQMVETLSDFLRAGLALDPSEDLTLERELALQSLYLSIEAVRFPARLRVEIRLPPELCDVRVPSLILQPLVENAIKHGVARSGDITLVEIDAAGEGDRLVLSVANGLADSGSRASPGTGVGLANVARRLELRYGAESEFWAGIEGGSRFVVRFSLPMRRAG